MCKIVKIVKALKRYSVQKRKEIQSSIEPTGRET
jgi:hypothetical protein